MINEQEKRNFLLFCIVAPEDVDDDLYKLFIKHLSITLNDGMTKYAIRESCKITPGLNVFQEQKSLSTNATYCLAITSADFFLTDECVNLLTNEIKEKLLQIKLRPCPDSESPYFKGRASLPRVDTIHSTKRNKDKLCEEIAQEVKKSLLARQTAHLEQSEPAPSFSAHLKLSTAVTTKPLSNAPLTPVASPTPTPPPISSTPPLLRLVTSARSLRHKKSFTVTSKVALCFLLLVTGWMLHSFADKNSWFSSQQPDSALTITNLADSGPGSLRQELGAIPPEQSAVLTFDTSLQPTTQGLVLKSSLVIDRNVTIETSNENPISAQISSQQQITITADSPQIAITVTTGNSVSFRNIQFRGIYGIANINNFPYANVRNPQPGAFLQVNEANVDLLNCEMSSFYSDTDGSALSNLYGNVTITSSIIENNIATGNGALYNSGLSSIGKGNLTLINSTIKDNWAFYSGGALDNLNGTLNILNNSTIQENRTLYYDAEIEGGGAITSQGGNILVSESTISSNQARRDGGGILLIGSNAQILSSTISGNTAGFTNGGGGIDVEPNHGNGQASYLTVSNTTLQDNIAGHLSQDVAGQILSNNPQPQLLVATSTVFQPASPTDAPKSLALDDFNTFCQEQIGSSGQHFFQPHQAQIPMQPYPLSHVLPRIKPRSN